MDPRIDPWAPTPYENADIGALQALAKGEASASQQVRALRWIVEQCANTYDLSYRPGSDRDSVFAEGKRFVGLQIVKLTKLNVVALRKQNDGRNPTEQPGGTGNRTGGRLDERVAPWGLTKSGRPRRKPGRKPGDKRQRSGA